ncbi:MAG: multidrug effflux MFS transporter [Microbacteriaceae bacterium]|nr:multidrug effflux MFS transporter [Microbacteriaceae bacterium]
MQKRRSQSGFRSSVAIFTPSFIFYTLCLAFAFGAYIAFVSAAPFLYQVVIGWSPLESGYMFAGQALLMTLSSFATSRIVMRVPTRVLLGIGVSLLVCAGLISLLIAVAGYSVTLYPPTLALVSIGIGIALPTAMALALAQARAAAGLASATLGFIQFILASSIAPLVSLGSAPLVTFAVVLTSAAGIAILAFVLGGISDRRAQSRSASLDGGPSA